MSKPEGAKCYIPRLEMTMREIPDKYHEALWELTGQGKSPKSVQATIDYIEGEGTQCELANKYGITEWSVRNVSREMVEQGYVELEYIQENCDREGKGVFGQFTNGECTWKP